MGWSGGTELMTEVIQSLVAEVPDDGARQAIYGRLIPAFWNKDWDGEDECEGIDPAFDVALKVANSQV